MEETTGTTIKRRGILAAAGAAVAGFVAKQTSQPVAATAINSAIYYQAVDPYPYNYVLWADSRSLASTENAIGVRGDARGTFQGIYGVGGNNNGTGVRGDGSGNGNGVEGNGAGTGYGVSGVGATGVRGSGGTYGVYGNGGPYGVYGSGTSYGVYGSGGSTGVYGSGSSYGAYGTSGTGHGVYGNTNAATGSGKAGVYGYGNGTGTYGVYGNGYSGTGVGVYGIATAGIGVQGSTSTGFAGVYGLAGSAQGSGGVVGVATKAGTIGFAGAAYAPATDAGYFTGNVSVFGTLAVTGAKSAAVRDAAGDYRLMYCVESPESWFEDFGTGTLANGAASVKMDPMFAQHVHTDSYHVFITENDQHNDLLVTGKTAQGFSVHADDATLKAKGKDAASVNTTFSWRVVAKRNDIKGERLPVWNMPAGATIPDAPTFAAEPKSAPPAPPPLPAVVPSPVPPSRPAGPGASDASSPVTPLPAPAPTSAPAVGGSAAPGAPNPLPPSRP